MSDVPPLRFPEFNGEWEKCKISDLLDFYSTNSLSWEQLECHDEFTLWTYPRGTSDYDRFGKRQIA